MKELINRFEEYPHNKHTLRDVNNFPIKPLLTIYILLQKTNIIYWTISLQDDLHFYMNITKVQIII